MKAEQKEIPLSNLGITVDPERFGMFNAACDTHNVHYDVENGHYTIILREDSILQDLYKNLSFALTTRPGCTPNHDALQRELSTLDML
jgi:hypothetical protein